MKIEMERTFLVSAESAPLPAAGIAIVQGYLAVEPDGNEARIRQKGEQHFLTVKSGQCGLARCEAEIEITAEQFNELWPLAKSRAIEKLRYTIKLTDNLLAEVDVFGGRHAGLILAEVEFQSEQQASLFSPPDWFGAEVTEDPQYRNKNLALQEK